MICVICLNQIQAGSEDATVRINVGYPAVSEYAHSSCAREAKERGLRKLCADKAVRELHRDIEEFERGEHHDDRRY